MHLFLNRLLSIKARRSGKQDQFDLLLCNYRYDSVSATNILLEPIEDALLVVSFNVFAFFLARKAHQELSYIAWVTHRWFQELALPYVVRKENL